MNLVVALLLASQSPPRDVLDYIVAMGAGAAVLATICGFAWFVIRLSTAALEGRVKALESHDKDHAAADDKRFERIETKLDGLRDILMGTTSTPAHGVRIERVERER